MALIVSDPDESFIILKVQLATTKQPILSQGFGDIVRKNHSLEDHGMAHYLDTRQNNEIQSGPPSTKNKPKPCPVWNLFVTTQEI